MELKVEFIGPKPQNRAHKAAQHGCIYENITQQFTQPGRTCIVCAVRYIPIPQLRNVQKDKYTFQI